MKQPLSHNDHISRKTNKTTSCFSYAKNLEERYYMTDIIAYEAVKKVIHTKIEF